MLRKEILARYQVKDGIIRDPGRFEHEAIYAVHYYAEWLNGGGYCIRDGFGRIATLFEITSDERSEFPEIPPEARTLYLSVSDQGFVFTQTLDLSSTEVAEALVGGAANNEN